MKKDKGRFSFVNIGSSLLLTVFLILCLVAFAMLSLSSAKSDYSVTEQFAEHKTNYFEASSHAEKVLSEVDSILERTAEAHGSAFSPAYSRAVTEELDGTSIDKINISCNAYRGTPLISYEVKSGKNQSLQVELLVTDFNSNDSYYEIRKWQLTSDEKWEGDNSVNLMPVD